MRTDAAVMMAQSGQRKRGRAERVTPASPTATTTSLTVNALRVAYLRLCARHSLPVVSETDFNDVLDRLAVSSRRARYPRPDESHGHMRIPHRPLYFARPTAQADGILSLTSAGGASTSGPLSASRGRRVGAGGGAAYGGGGRAGSGTRLRVDVQLADLDVALGDVPLYRALAADVRSGSV